MLSIGLNQAWLMQ